MTQIERYNPLNAAYQQMRSGAQQGAARIRGAVSSPRNIRLAGIGGALAVPLDAALQFSTRKERGEDDLRAGSGALASAGGGAAGAKLGMTLGSKLGPLGMIAGGLLGYAGGSMAGGAVSDAANDTFRGTYEGYDSSAAAIAKSLANRDSAVASGDPMKAATAMAETERLARERRMQSLENTGAIQSMAAVGQGIQSSMSKDLPGQTNTATPYSNTGLEDLSRDDPEYRTEMAGRRLNDMQRSNALFQSDLAERGGRFATGQQQIMEGARTRNSMLQQYLAGAQQGNTSALISAYNQRY